MSRYTLFAAYRGPHGPFTDNASDPPFHLEVRYYVGGAAHVVSVALDGTLQFKNVDVDSFLHGANILVDTGEWVLIENPDNDKVIAAAKREFKRVPKERVHPQWDRITDEERDQLLALLLEHNGLAAYRINDGNSIYMEVEKQG